MNFNYHKPKGVKEGIAIEYVNSIVYVLVNDERFDAINEYLKDKFFNVKTEETPKPEKKKLNFNYNLNI